MVGGTANVQWFALFITTPDSIIQQVGVTWESIVEDPSYRALRTILEELLGVLVRGQDPVLEFKS